MVDELKSVEYCEPFNSLSRDHSEKGCDPGHSGDFIFQLPLSGSLPVLRRFGDSLCLLYQTFNSLSRDHELKDSHIFVRSASRNSLSTPSLGITERRGPSPKSLCLNSNFQLPLSGSLPTFTKTSSAFLVSFNSLSRDHMFDKILDFILASPLRLSTPSLGITVPAEMMNPPGSIILSTPSLGITKFKVKHNIVFSYMTFQLPLSGSR